MERRRQMGDIGIVAQRYELVLFGSAPAPRAAAVAAGERAHGAGAVHVDQGHLVHDEARSPEHGRRQGARPRQGLAEGRGRAGGMDDRAHRSDRQRSKGAAGPVRGRAVTGRRRIRVVLRQRPGVCEYEEMRRGSGIGDPGSAAT